MQKNKGTINSNNNIEQTLSTSHELKIRGFPCNLIMKTKYPTPTFDELINAVLPICDNDIKHAKRWVKRRIDTAVILTNGAICYTDRLTVENEFYFGYPWGEEEYDEHADVDVCRFIEGDFNDGLGARD